MFIFAVIMVFLILPTQADVYREMDNDGNVVYTDQPQGRAQAAPIGLPPINRMEPTESRPAMPEAAEKAPFAGYVSAVIVSPRPNKLVPSEQRSIMVQLALKPQLRPDHRVQFWLDDQPLGMPVAQINYEIIGLERGSHRISTQIVNLQGRSLVTLAPVTVQVQRHFKRH